MITIEKLRNYGADVDDGLRRCFNAEDFYLELVKSVVPDTRIDALDAAINANDLDTAFELAHALKGMYGNLSLTPLCEPVIEITELLRNRTETDYSSLMEKIKAERDRFVALNND